MATVAALAEKFEVPVGELLASETLDLSRGALEDEDVGALPVLLQTGAWRLDLSFNFLSDATAAIIATAATQSPTLHALHLNNNHITSAGCTAIAQALGPSTGAALEVINLCGNDIDDAGAVAFAEMLLVNVTVRELNLGVNFIADAGGRALAAMLRTNQTLVELSLHENLLTDDGAVALAEALADNQTLALLTLDANNITDASVDSIVRAIEVNSTVTTLGLSSGLKCGPGGAAVAPTALSPGPVCTLPPCAGATRSPPWPRIASSKPGKALAGTAMNCSSATERTCARPRAGLRLGMTGGSSTRAVEIDARQVTARRG